MGPCFLVGVYSIDTCRIMHEAHEEGLGLLRVRFVA